MTQEEHARLVGRIALHLLQPNGRIPPEWIGGELDRLDRTEGDLDFNCSSVSRKCGPGRYVANRNDWLADAEELAPPRARVEDKLSDALHAALTQRFIDRRTSALLKGLKREDTLLAAGDARMGR